MKKGVVSLQRVQEITRKQQKQQQLNSGRADRIENGKQL